MIVRRRVIITQPEQTLSLHQSFSLVLKLNNPYLMQIVRVLERKGKEFVFDY